MSDETQAMTRAMSGQLHEVIRERTGIDIRGMRDPYPLYQIERLRRWATVRKRKSALMMLDRATKHVIIKQQLEITKSLDEDISRLGIYSGNQKHEITRSDIV